MTTSRSSNRTCIRPDSTNHCRSPDRHVRTSRRLTWDRYGLLLNDVVGEQSRIFRITLGAGCYLVSIFSSVCGAGVVTVTVPSCVCVIPPYGYSGTIVPSSIFLVAWWAGRDLPALSASLVKKRLKSRNKHCLHCLADRRHGRGA